jgi:hypothetical protein
MTTSQALPAAGMFVVETYDGRAFLGEVERHGGTVTVYSGLAGRPPVLEEDEVALITAAAEHPDVEVV